MVTSILIAVLKEPYWEFLQSVLTLEKNEVFPKLF